MAPSFKKITDYTILPLYYSKIEPSSSQISCDKQIMGTITKQDWIFRHSRPAGTINWLELWIRSHVQAAGTLTSIVCSKHRTQTYFNNHMKDNLISIWQVWKLTIDCPSAILTDHSLYVYSWACTLLISMLLWARKIQCKHLLNVSICGPSLVQCERSTEWNIYSLFTLNVTISTTEGGSRNGIQDLGKLGYMCIALVKVCVDWFQQLIYIHTVRACSVPPGWLGIWNIPIKSAPLH